VYKNIALVRCCIGELTPRVSFDFFDQTSLN